MNNYLRGISKKYDEEGHLKYEITFDNDNPIFGYSYDKDGVKKMAKDQLDDVAKSFLE